MFFPVIPFGNLSGTPPELSLEIASPILLENIPAIIQEMLRRISPEFPSKK